jgi:protocatechuate 3,4-dioxygenase beta subunit
MPNFTAQTLAFAFVLLTCNLSGAAQQRPSDVADAPANPPSSARIAAAQEPGTSIRINGTVLAADGKTPVPNAIVYGYHTDANGYYRGSGRGGDAGEDQPRLRGWARTDASGHFSFLTIKPAPYPHRNVPAHVHVHVWGPNLPRQWFELEFEGDPMIATQHFTDNTADFLDFMRRDGTIGGVQNYSVTIRVATTSNFPASD